MSEKEQSDLKRIRGVEQRDDKEVVVEDYDGEVGGAEKLPADVFSPTVAQHVERRMVVDENQLSLAFKIISLTSGAVKLGFEQLKKCVEKAMQLKLADSQRNEQDIVIEAVKDQTGVDLNEKKEFPDSAEEEPKK